MDTCWDFYFVGGVWLLAPSGVGHRVAEAHFSDTVDENNIRRVPELRRRCWELEDN